MSNSNCFKCLFEFNSYKYSVIIDNNNENQISFDSLLSQIKIQTNEENISLESHSFEIFDNDFNEYVLMTNKKQLIKHLSRIRVTSKVMSRSNTRVSSVSSVKQSIVSNKTSKSSLKSGNNYLNSKSLIDFNSNPINTTDKVKNYLEMNESPNSYQPNDTFSQKSSQNQAIYTSTINYFTNNSQKNSINTENSFKQVLDQKKNNSVKRESNLYSRDESSSVCSTIKSTKVSGFTTQSNQSIKYEKKQFVYSKRKPNHEINYFGPKITKSGSSPNSCQLIYQTCLANYGNKTFICLKFSENELKAYKKLIQLLILNKHLFIDEISKVSVTEFQWITISDQMIRSGFNWRPKKCMDSFIGSINLYIKIIENSNNYEIAKKVYPLFEIIHSTDLYYFIRNGVYSQLIELKNRFNKNTKIETKPKDLQKFNNSTKQSSQASQNSTANTVRYFAPKVLTQLRGAKQPSLDFKHKIEFIENQNICVLEFSPREVNACKLLLKSISQTSPVFTTLPNLRSGSKALLNTFWKNISNLMIKQGFDNWNHQKCYQCFNEYLDLYKTVLSKAPNRLIASKVYPLFDIIDSYDLKSYDDIQEMKTEFVKKCGQSSAQSQSQINTNDNSLSNNYTVKEAKKSENSISCSAKPLSYFNEYVLTKNKDSDKHYLNYEVIVETIGIQSVYALKLDSTELKAYKLLLQTMTLNKHLFRDAIISDQNNGSNTALNNIWKSISNLLIIKGYDNWDSNKCYQCFIHSVKLYKQVLKNVPNREIASKVYQLFDIIEIFDLQSFLKTRLYSSIEILKTDFEIKNKKEITVELSQNRNNDKLVVNNVIENQKQVSNNTESDINEIFNKLKGLNIGDNESAKQVIEEIDTRHIENWKLQTVIDFKLSETIKRYVIKVVVKYDKALSLMLKKSTEISNIKFRFVKLSPEDQTIFQFIVKFINENQNYFYGNHKCDDKWQIVSDQMIGIGFKDFTAVKCKELFQTWKSVYIQILQYTPNCKIASQIFPIFSTFHKMDLKCLSQEKTFNKIMILRNRPEFDSQLIQ